VDRQAQAAHAAERLAPRRDQSFIQGSQECSGIDDASPRGVDHEGSLLHLLEGLVTEQVACLRSQGNVDTQVIAGPEQLLETDVRHFEPFSVSLPARDRRRGSGDRIQWLSDTPPPDLTETDNAQGLSLDPVKRVCAWRL